MSYLVDTHCHLDMDPYHNDMKDVIERSFNMGVEKIIVPSVDADSFDKVIKIAEEFENVYCGLGIHPTDAVNSQEKDFGRIIELGNHQKVVMIGECGLDYYWDKTTKDVQKQVFARQIEIAKKLQKPLNIHDREAHKECFDMLVDGVKGEVPVIMHCFSGSPEFALECVNKGFYIALGGIVTFKNAKKVHEVAKTVPLERLMLETDAPYLAPTPHRGDRNEPGYVKFIAEEIARLRGVDFETVCEVTSNNVNKVFGI